MQLRLVTLAGLALVATACKSTTTTTTTVSGTPVVQPAPAAAAPAAAAPAAAPAAEVNPAGKWLLGLVAQGQSMEVTLDLVKLPDGTWSGSIGTAAFGTIGLSKATLAGKVLTATFPVPTGDMGTMVLTINGNMMEGEWSMPGDGSKVSGKKN